MQQAADAQQGSVQGRASKTLSGAVVQQALTQAMQRAVQASRKANKGRVLCAPLRPLGKKPPVPLVEPRVTMARTWAGVRAKAMAMLLTGACAAAASQSAHFLCGASG